MLNIFIFVYFSIRIYSQSAVHVSSFLSVWEVTPSAAGEFFCASCFSLCCFWTSAGRRSLLLFPPWLIQSGRAVLALSACQEVMDDLSLSVNCLSVVTSRVFFRRLSAAGLWTSDVQNEFMNLTVAVVFIESVRWNYDGAETVFLWVKPFNT